MQPDLRYFCRGQNRRHTTLAEREISAEAKLGASRHDGNPADFDDYTWLTEFYSIDGKQIVALAHMEYHGWEHAGMCASKPDTASCWYNVDTFLTSSDGGYHFTSPKPPV